VATAVSTSLAVRANRLLRENEKAYFDRDAARRPLEALGFIYRGTSPEVLRTYVGSPDPAKRATAEEAARALVEALKILDVAPVDSWGERAMLQATGGLSYLRALDDAARWSERTVERFPRSLVALDGLHHIRHLRRERCADVRRRILEVARGAGDETQVFAWIALLEDAVDAGDLARAHQLALKIERGSLVPTLYHLLAGRLFLELGRNDPVSLETAESHLRQYSGLYSRDPDALALHGFALVAAGHFEALLPHPGEVRSWEMALEVDPRAPLAVALKSHAREVELDAEGALETARQALAVAPNDPEARLAEARALLLADRPAQALDAASRILERGDETRALMVRAFALLALDRDDDARATFVRACEPTLGDAARENTWAHVGLVLVAQRSGDRTAYSAAWTWVQEHQEKGRHNEEPLFFVRAAKEWERRGNRPNARRCAETLAKLYERCNVPVPKLASEMCRALEDEKPR
jgi:tetratricopeptide (TPR) repeat protein